MCHEKALISFHRWRKKGTLRPSGSLNGDGLQGSNPEKGNYGAGWCLPYPEYERVPFAPERVAVSFPWSRDQVLGPLSCITADDRTFL